ncbi:MAG: DUF6114 domain-containing protein [Ktedonobacteraceae bacterium]
MAAPDDSEVCQPNDDATDPVQAASESTPVTEQIEGISSHLRRGWWVNSAQLVASLRKIRFTSQAHDEAEPVVASTDPTQPVRVILGKSRRKAKKDNLQNWDTWSKFHLWRRTRPLWGSLLMFLGALLMLALPISLLRFAFLLDSLWASTLIGALLLVMALVQLFVPSYSVLTGSIGIVLSLVSFITSSFGGLIIGMLLGIIGGALSLSWRPVKRSRLMAARSTATP